MSLYRIFPFHTKSSVLEEKNGHVFAACYYGRCLHPIYVCIYCRIEVPNLIVSPQNLRDPAGIPLRTCPRGRKIKQATKVA